MAWKYDKRCRGTFPWVALVNADEVIGTGTPSAPNPVIQHPSDYVNHMVNYWSGWYATAGVARIAPRWEAR